MSKLVAPINPLLEPKPWGDLIERLDRDIEQLTSPLHRSVIRRLLEYQKSTGWEAPHLVHLCGQTLLFVAGWRDCVGFCVPPVGETINIITSGLRPDTKDRAGIVLSYTIADIEQGRHLKQLSEVVGVDSPK